MMALSLLAAGSLRLGTAQPPWRPWIIENLNLVDGKKNQHSPHVFVAGKTTTMEDCQALCTKNATCFSFDWSGLRSEEHPCSSAGTCYLRNDDFWKPGQDNKCNHTCGIRVKPGGGAGPPPPAPAPPLPPPPPVHPPLGHQPNIVFILTDGRCTRARISWCGVSPDSPPCATDQDRTLGQDDYTHLGSLEIMPIVRRELIAKGGVSC